MRFQIGTRCDEDWEAMSPAEGGRRCARCAHDVLDLTGLTRRQAERAVRRAGPAPCIRIRVDGEGAPRFRDEPLRSVRRLPVLALAGALAACEAAPAPSEPAAPAALVDAPAEELDWGPPMLPVGEAPEVSPEPEIACEPEPEVEAATDANSELDAGGPTASQRARTRRKHRPPPTVIEMGFML